MPRSCPSALRPASSCHGLGGAPSAGAHLPTCHLFPSPPLLCSSHSSTCGPPSPTGCHGHETSACSSAVVSSAWRTRARVKSRRAFSACPSCLSAPGPCGRVWAVGSRKACVRQRTRHAASPHVSPPGGPGETPFILETVGEWLSTRSRSSFRLRFSSVSSCTLRDRLSRTLLAFFCLLRLAFFSDGLRARNQAADV